MKSQSPAADPFGSTALLRVALPLIASVACFSVTLFTDRTLLLWFDPISSGAAIAAGNLYWAFACLPVTAMGFVTPLVAQAASGDAGRQRDDRIADIIRQGIWLTLIVGPFFAIPAVFADHLFLQAGHEASLARLESTYFRTLMLLVPASMLEAGLSAYFVGRRQTRPVLVVNILTSVINVALDALLIFGMLGFPQLGIWGAALATVISAWLKVGFYGWLIVRDSEFRSRLTSSLRLSVSTAREIALPGLAVGFQNQIRTLVFSGVLMAIGATSAISLAASSATFTVYQLLAIPVIGLANAVTVFAGQASSSGTPQLRKTVRSSFRVAGIYAVGLAGTMLFFPEAVLWPMTIGMQAEERMTVIPRAAVFMRFAAFYCLSETAGMISGSLIKGMGRTSLMLLTTGFCSLAGYLILQAVDAGQRFSTDQWWLALVIWSTAQAAILTAATFRQASLPNRSSADEDDLEVHKPAVDSSPEAAACSVTS